MASVNGLECDEVSKLFLFVSGDCHLDDLRRVFHRAVVQLRTHLDLIDGFHTGNDLTPYGVYSVKIIGGVEADEKLAVCGIRIVGAGHGYSATHMRSLAEFGHKALTRAARAVALGIAGLGHESGDDAVEGQPVIKSLTHQFLNALDVLGGQIGAQLDRHAARRQIEENRIFRIEHRFGVGGFGGHRENSNKESKKKGQDVFHGGYHRKEIAASF